MVMENKLVVAGGWGGGKGLTTRGYWGNLVGMMELFSISAVVVIASSVHFFKLLD